MEPRMQKHTRDVYMYKNWLCHRYLLINEERTKRWVSLFETIFPQVKKRRNKFRFSVWADAKREGKFSGETITRETVAMFLLCTGNRFVSPHEFVAYRLIVSRNKVLNQMQTVLNFYTEALHVRTCKSRRMVRGVWKYYRKVSVLIWGKRLSF